jgi:hypothetical protein
MEKKGGKKGRVRKEGARRTETKKPKPPKTHKPKIEERNSTKRKTNKRKSRQQGRCFSYLNLIIIVSTIGNRIPLRNTITQDDIGVVGSSHDLVRSTVIRSSINT